MEYRVVKDFADALDRGHIYRAGDVYPRSGKPSEARVAELSGFGNKIGIPLIEAFQPKEHTIDCADPTTHSTELCHMTKAQLMALAKEQGRGELKPTMRKSEMIELIEGE